MKKKFLLPVLITLVFAALSFYFTLPAINIKSPDFYSYILSIVVVFFVSYFFFNFKNSARYMTSVSGIKNATPKVFRIAVLTAVSVFLIIFLLGVFSGEFFHAKTYRNQIVATESDFVSDIKEVSFSQIPVVDRDTAMRLGSRKIGEVVELVSQFNVSNLYTQINYNAKPTRVSPLEYADFFKWLFNREEGIPYYVQIDMTSQETKLVHLSEGMKYLPSEKFNRNLTRHLRFNYPTKMFDKLFFEVDEEGTPYFIMSTYEYEIFWNGGKNTEGVIVCNAITGETVFYKVGEVPRWIDNVFPSELVLEQIDNYGAYEHGFWNSVFGQKGVIMATEGYNYLALTDDVWLYTGLTSVVSDESNVGFILVNLRTKETKTYAVNGAEEFSAMASAEGKVQEKGYFSTFPILLNIADRPTYFLSLKDAAGLVKQYAFVSVEQFQLVGVGDTIAQAQKAYVSLLTENGEVPDKSRPVLGFIETIASAVKNGNTYYYIKLKDNSTIFIASIEISDVLPMLKADDSIELKATPLDDKFDIVEEIRTTN